MDKKTKQIQDTVRKTLCYALCLDIVKGAVSTLGSVNAADKTAVTGVVYDELTNAAKAQKA